MFGTPANPLLKYVGRTKSALYQGLSVLGAPRESKLETLIDRQFNLKYIMT